MLHSGPTCCVAGRCGRYDPVDTISWCRLVHKAQQAVSGYGWCASLLCRCR